MDNVIERLLKQKNERISDLENENKALGIINDEIGKLNKNLIEENKNLKLIQETNEKQSIEHILELEEENRKLKEKLDILEKAKFEVMAYIDMCHPKTYLEAEELQKRKELFERIYNEKLYYLEKENKQLREDIGKLAMKL